MKSRNENNNNNNNNGNSNGQIPQFNIQDVDDESNTISLDSSQFQVSFCMENYKKKQLICLCQICSKFSLCLRPLQIFNIILPLPPPLFLYEVCKQFVTLLLRWWFIYTLAY